MNFKKRGAISQDEGRPEFTKVLTSSILKYSDQLEYLCTHHEYAQQKDKEHSEALPTEESQPEQASRMVGRSSRAFSVISGLPNTLGVTSKAYLSVGDILDSMFPPKVVHQQDGVYLQRVLARDLERHELNLIETQLQIKLGETKAKKSGICEEREELHNQLFDEIIRQATINCPERGMLLFKVRDQIKMTLGSYKVLHQGSIVYGQQKNREALEGYQERQDTIQALQQHKTYLENKLDGLQIQEKRLKESLVIINRPAQQKREEELFYLSHNNKQLQTLLSNLIEE